MKASFGDTKKRQKEGRKMKKYLVKITYGWSKYEIEHSPYTSMQEVEAENEVKAVFLEIMELNKSYLGGEKNIPCYYKILGFMEIKDGNQWLKHHTPIYIQGKAGDIRGITYGIENNEE